MLLHWGVHRALKTYCREQKANISLALAEESLIQYLLDDLFASELSIGPMGGGEKGRITNTTGHPLTQGKSKYSDLMLCKTQFSILPSSRINDRSISNVYQSF